MFVIALRSRIRRVAPTIRLPGALAAERSSLGSLASLLADVTGVRRPVFTVSLGANRPQSKPVIQVIAPDGRTVAHAKVGWNSVTKPLVSHEHQMLMRISCASPRTFRVPSILFAGDWNGRELLVVRHGGSRPWFRPADLRIPDGSIRELTQLGEQQRAPLAETQYWCQLVERVTRLVAAGGSLAEPIAVASSRILHRYAETNLSLGFVHGDWVPWNMASLADGLLVWDWERACESGPLGMDALFFLFQTDVWVRGREPLSAFARLRNMADPLLLTFGLRAQNASLLLALLTLEIAVRQEEGAVEGVRVPPRMYDAIRHLVSTVDEATANHTRTSA